MKHQVSCNSLQLSIQGQTETNASLAMQWEEMGSLPWFQAPTTCDTHSFNHLSCDATHHVAPDFKPICLANLRQCGSLNAYKFVHTVQRRKIQKCYLMLAAFFFSPKNHPCFHEVAFNCWLWTRTITVRKERSCFDKRAQGWLKEMHALPRLSRSAQWGSDHQEMRYFLLFLKWDEMAHTASYS